MQDLTEMAYELRQKTSNDMEHQKMYTEKLLEELAKEKSADIAPHLNVVFDVIKNEYVVTLRIGVDSNIFDTVKSDIE